MQLIIFNKKLEALVPKRISHHDFSKKNWVELRNLSHVWAVISTHHLLAIIYRSIDLSIIVKPFRAADPSHPPSTWASPSLTHCDIKTTKPRSRAQLECMAFKLVCGEIVSIYLCVDRHLLFDLALQNFVLTSRPLSAISLAGNIRPDITLQPCAFVFSCLAVTNQLGMPRLPRWNSLPQFETCCYVYFILYLFIYMYAMIGCSHSWAELFIYL